MAARFPVSIWVYGAKVRSISECFCRLRQGQSGTGPHISRRDERAISRQNITSSKAFQCIGLTMHHAGCRRAGATQSPASATEQIPLQPISREALAKQNAFSIPRGRRPPQSPASEPLFERIDREFAPSSSAPDSRRFGSSGRDRIQNASFRCQATPQLIDSSQPTLQRGSVPNYHPTTPTFSL